jgi:class 3 adenylate cyclase
VKSGSIIALPGAPESFTLAINNNQTICIGRKAKSEGQETFLVLPYPEVSSKHAEIRCTANTWTIIDNGSTNGTTINGVRLNAGKEYVLQDQDIVGIANYNLLVSIPNKGSNESSGGKDIEVEQDKTHIQVKLINATILVADLKNFTSLMEEYTHDPSIVMEATTNVFAQLSQEIGNSIGQLEKIAGDAIMAYWCSGSKYVEASVASFRACSTALRLKEITVKLAGDKKSWPFPKHPLVFDIALATGTVASGALGKSQGNPALLGDTANLAFRMEKLIPDDERGKIIVDQNTYDLVRENFEFKFLGEFAIKGRHNIVNVYQLLKAMK